MYVVTMTSKDEGARAIQWEPAKGDGFQCGKREALRRWGHLLEQGQRGVSVDGVVPWCVEIRSDSDDLMLGVTTEPDDSPVGAWAQAKAA